MRKASRTSGIALLLWASGSHLLAQPAYPSPEALQMRERAQPTTVEVGARNTSGDSGTAKFSEYRDLGTGTYLRNLNLLWESPFSGYYFRLLSRENSGQDLQSLLTAGIYGKHKITVLWNRILHDTATSGRNTFVRTGRESFQLPSGFQSLQDAPIENLLAKRDAVSIGYAFTPDEVWNAQLQYSPERRMGSRAGGNNFRFTVFELPEPIEYRTDNWKASIEASKSKWTLQGSSETSFFHNDVKSLEWTTSFPANGPMGQGVGRKALPPGNSAQSLQLSGALNLARSARVVATVSPGWMHQDEAFLPYTVSSSIQAQPGYPALPAPSLKGDKQTLMMNYLLTGRVKTHFSYNARYRSYRLDNQTPSLLFSNYVDFDSDLPPSTQAGPRARQSLPYGYRKQNASFEWIWAPAKTASAKWFYQWESWNRSYREVDRSNEHTVGASWDWMNESGWGIQALMQHSLRRPRQYNPESYTAMYPAGTGIYGLSQLPGLRRYDEAERSRNYGTASFQAPPVHRLEFSVGYTADRSFYNRSQYGSLYDLSEGATVDLSYPLRSSVSLFADYTFERLRYALRSRQRLDGAPAIAPVDSANNDWESHIRDRIHTLGAGVNSGFFKNKIVLDVYYNFSQGDDKVATAALGNAAVAGFLVTSAEDYPRLSNRFQRLTSSLKFPITNTISYRIEYDYERYGERDVALESVIPLIGPTNQGTPATGFLLPTLPRYRVNIFSVSLLYVFGRTGAAE